MALGTTELIACMTLWPPTSTPLISRTSSNSEASSTSTSRNIMGTSLGMRLSPRCSISLWSYSALSPAWRRLATMWISPSRLASSTNLSAASSSSMRSCLSSSERYTRETSEVATIAPMKKREINMPSGRFISLATSAYMNTAVTTPKAIAGNLEPPRQHTRGVGACLRVHVGGEDDRDDDGYGGVDDHERPYRPSPLGSHPISG